MRVRGNSRLAGLARTNYYKGKLETTQADVFLRVKNIFLCKDAHMRAIHFPVFALTTMMAALCAAETQPEDPPCRAERWEKAIGSFLAADEKEPPAEQGILFVGSSSIRLWNLPKYFPKLQPINRGFGGSEICDSTHWIEQLVLKHKPRLVVLYAGDNDIAVGKSAEQVHRDFSAFCKKLYQQLPETKLLYIAIKPSLSRWKHAPAMKEANALITADCKKDARLTFVDIWPPMLGKDGKPRPELFAEDGLHLNEQGYALWTGLLRQHLSKEKETSAATP